MRAACEVGSWNGSAATKVPLRIPPDAGETRQAIEVTASFVGVTEPVIVAVVAVTELAEISPRNGGDTRVSKRSIVGDAAVPAASVAKNA